VISNATYLAAQPPQQLLELALLLHGVGLGLLAPRRLDRVREELGLLVGVLLAHDVF
jgi:hypothetical protein